MFNHSSFVVLLAACSLLAGPGHATGTRPAPTRRPPAVRQPTAATLVAAATPPPSEVASPLPPEPPTVRVSGTVRGADGQPRPGVSVFLSANPRLLAITDAKGTFSLQLPATAGTFRLQADYFGLGNSHFEVDAQHPQSVDIVLGQ